MFRYFTFKRLLRYFFLLLARMPMRGHHRWRILRLAGIRFDIPNGEKPRIAIYGGVYFDTLHPENITVGNRAIITAGCRILTHYLDTGTPSGFVFRTGKVTIGHGAFIGVNTVICNSVTIGEWAVVGAGSVVTKNIPPYEVWAGNPARFIKRRGACGEKI